MWEIVRSFNPIEFSKLLYLLENVMTSTKRMPVTLPETIIDYDPSAFERDIQLVISDFPTIRLERGDYQDGGVFWNDGSNTNDNDAGDNDDDFTIDTLFSHIRCNNLVRLNGDSPTHPMAWEGSEQTNQSNASLKFRVLNHNLGTTHYKTLLRQIAHLLFNDNYQSDRNELNIEPNSVVRKFMQFYGTMNFKQRIDSDARNFRSLILPKPRRIFDRDQVNSPEHIVQPLYQGFHVIVYSSPNETKCYSRCGTLHQGRAYSVRCAEPCTFEAIVLPVDKYNNVRCWRYWPFRSNFVMYVVDVFRYKQTILTSTPFSERAKYIDLIVKNQPDILFAAPRDDSWLAIEEQYVRRRDIYDPIVGVVLRHPQHTITADSQQRQQPQHAPTRVFYFNILVSYDILSAKIVELCESQPLDMARRLHLNYEMADYKTVCIVYGHCDRALYICTYNRVLQQFVHAATLTRSAMECFQLKYKPEKIFVVNNKTLPRGILYLRVYYDLSKKIIGYENKPTDDRFKSPFTNPLL